MTATDIEGIKALKRQCCGQDRPESNRRAVRGCSPECMRTAFCTSAFFPLLKKEI
jgi:hypothetical protein